MGAVRRSVFWSMFCAVAAPSSWTLSLPSNLPVRKSAAPQSEEALRNLNVWSTASGDLVFSLIEKRREVWWVG